MQVGIIGPPGGGKSTLFHALTGKKAGVSGRLEMVHGTAEVPDRRVEVLAERFEARKFTRTVVEYIDAPPIESGGLKREGFRREFLRGLEQADALLFVIPHFLSSGIDEDVNKVKNLETEFILSDLELLEKRMEKISRDIQRGVKGDVVREQELLKRCVSELEDEKLLRDLEFAEDEEKSLRGFAFLTIKPLLPVLNIAEEDLPRIDSIVSEFSEKWGGREAVAICAEIQSEIADLPEEEIPEFLEGMGVSERARDRILGRTRKMLDLITFLTVSESEARAWDLKRGSTALKAAGTVHTDMERGFIRAEVFNFDDLGDRRSYGELRSAGVLRSEGRDYLVRDGDVMLFRFNV